MNPDQLRAQVALLLRSKSLDLRAVGWFLYELADETDRGLWPRSDAVPTRFPGPGTVAFAIARETRMAAA